MATQVGLISLGCTKNLVDSEVMLGLLREKGYSITPHEEEADILIVNTCAFIDEAKRESLDTILQLVNSDVGHNRKIIVTGCLAQRYAEQLKSDLGDEIHAILGTGDLQRIMDACESALAGSSFYKVSNHPDFLYQHNTPRLLTTPAHYAYVKIAEGCDNRCSYCVIPNVRGRYRSRSMKSVVAEVSSLADAGVREINLIAQDTTYYGRDRSDNEQLTSLLRDLIRIPDVRWIRVLYGHPAHISEDFLKLMADEEKICSYIDLPVQHIHDDILSRMGRKITRSQIYGLIDKIRDIVPDVTLRTSLIVGFPGEKEHHFDELMKFIKYARFSHLGVFLYSVEEGTRAAGMEYQVDNSISIERLDRVAQLHQEIAEDIRRGIVGKREVVIIDRDGDQAYGRTQGQAPEIDDVVYIEDSNVQTGEFLDVEIVDTCGAYDLIGKAIK